MISLAPFSSTRQHFFCNSRIFIHLDILFKACCSQPTLRSVHCRGRCLIVSTMEVYLVHIIGLLLKDVESFFLGFKNWTRTLLMIETSWGVICQQELCFMLWKRNINLVCNSSVCFIFTSFACYCSSYCFCVFFTVLKFSVFHTSHPSPTVTQQQWLPKSLRPPQSCPSPIPRGPRTSSLSCASPAAAHRVYVLCNCRPQSEQEASVCQNSCVLPSSKGLNQLLHDCRGGAGAVPGPADWNLKKKG